MITVVHVDYGYAAQKIAIGTPRGMHNAHDGMYACADLPPNYPVPTLIGPQLCAWCSSNYAICDYNETGEWCPSMCFDC